MAEKVIMPKLEMAQESGKIIDWLKQEGDSITKGEALFTIETDKVTIDIESPASGILAGIRSSVGDEVPISTVIAYIITPGEELPGEFTKVTESGLTAPVKAPTIVEATPSVLISPIARKIAEEHNVDPRTVSGIGPRGQITKSDIERIIASSSERYQIGKIRATPAARRIAKQRGIELASLQGSGPKGRIQVIDIPASSAARELQQSTGYELVRLEGMRKTIAQKMVVSFQTIPHIYFEICVDMSTCEKARQQANSEAQKLGLPKVTITAFFVLAVALALKRNPYLNSTLIDEEIHLIHDINIGVAVALDNGLIVPVIHNADQYGLLEISNRLNDLTTRARVGKLVPKDVSGGTFTISNLGPYGIDRFTAIINPPQTAILAIGAMQKEVVPDKDGEIIVKPITHLTVSTDHRVVDGVMAARFLQDLKSEIEKARL